MFETSWDTFLGSLGMMASAHWTVTLARSEGSPWRSNGLDISTGSNSLQKRMEAEIATHRK
jgi:hypothetical protein